VPAWLAQTDDLFGEVMRIEVGCEHVRRQLLLSRRDLARGERPAEMVRRLVWAELRRVELAAGCGCYRAVRLQMHGLLVTLEPMPERGP